MFDGLLKSKFYSKCKSDMKLTRARIEVIQRKRNAIQKYLRNDVTDLLRNGLGMNAYSRVEGLLIEINRSNCYELIDKCCVLISNHLTSMNKQRDCPEECRESVSSLMFAAARIADLPDLRELRDLFSEKYGNSLDCFANKELMEKLRCGVPSRDEKFQLLQEIAAESGLVWSPKALDFKLFKEEADNKDLYKETNGGDFMIKNEFLGPENVKLDGRSLHKKENAPVIKPIEGHDRSSVAARNHQERVEKHHGEPKASDMKLFKEQADNKDLAEETKGGDFMIKNGFLGPENVNLDRRSLQKNENTPVIKPIEGPNHQERAEKHRGKYGLIAPPYSKSGAEKTKVASEESKPVPESVRRRHLKPVREISEDDDEGDKVKVANKEQAAQAQRVLKFFDRGNEGLDEEERAMDRLLRHYSKKKGSHTRVKSEIGLKYPSEKKDFSQTGLNGPKKEANGREFGPVRVLSLPGEVSGPNEESGFGLKPPLVKKEFTKTGSNGKEWGPGRVLPGPKEESVFVLKPPFEKKFTKTGPKEETKGREFGPVRVLSLPGEVSGPGPNEKSKRHFRASSFQPEMLDENRNRVHPKLPNCDDFEARLAELRRKPKD